MVVPECGEDCECLQMSKDQQCILREQRSIITRLVASWLLAGADFRESMGDGNRRADGLGNSDPAKTSAALLLKRFQARRDWRTRPFEGLAAKTWLH